MLWVGYGSLRKRLEQMSRGDDRIKHYFVSARTPDELYRLTDDPKEQHNLIDEHHDVAVKLASRFGASFFRRGRASSLQGVQGKYELASGSVE